MFDPILAKMGTSEALDPLLDNVVEPAAILPAQYFSKNRDRECEGELRLLAAVLEDAVRSYLSNRNAASTQRRQEFWENKRWFQSHRQSSLLDFETICGLLEIDPDAVRRMLVTSGRRQRPQAAQPHRVAVISRQAA